MVTGATARQGGEAAGDATPCSTSPPDPLHWLVITEHAGGVREWDIEHPDPACIDRSLPALVATRYKCDVGRIEYEGGEYAVPGWDSLAPGRYRIAAWHSHQPGTVNGPAEWDAGITILDDEPIHVKTTDG